MPQQLNHLNLSVQNVAENVEFFQTHFGFRIIAGQGKNLTVLTNEDGFILTLMFDKSLLELAYPAMFHLGFLQRGHANVDAIHQKLIDAGADVPQPMNMRRDTYGFYVRAPGGFLIEVSSYEEPLLVL